MKHFKLPYSKESPYAAVKHLKVMLLCFGRNAGISLQQTSGAFHLCKVLWNDEEIECDVEKPAGFRNLPLDYYSIRFHLTIRPCICILLSLRLLTGGWSCEPTAKSVLQTSGQICFSARKGGTKKRERICLFLLIIPSLTVKPSSFFHSRRAVSTCFNTSHCRWRIHHKGNLWHCLFVGMEMVGLK